MIDLSSLLFDFKTIKTVCMYFILKKFKTYLRFSKHLLGSLLYVTLICVQMFFNTMFQILETSWNITLGKISSYKYLG